MRELFAPQAAAQRKAFEDAGMEAPAPLPPPPRHALAAVAARRRRPARLPHSRARL